MPNQLLKIILIKFLKSFHIYFLYQFKINITSSPPIFITRNKKIKCYLKCHWNQSIYAHDFKSLHVYDIELFFHEYDISLHLCRFNFMPFSKTLYSFFLLFLYLIELNNCITLQLLFCILLLKSFMHFEKQTIPKAPNNSAHGLGIRKIRGQELRAHHSWLQQMQRVYDSPRY